MAQTEPVDEPAESRTPEQAAAQRQSLDQLYRAHHQVIWRTVRRMGFSPEASADATHQAYVIAAERIDQIYIGSEKAFLFSTAIRLAKTTRRKEQRLELHEDIDLGTTSGGGDEEAATRQTALQLLDRVLSRMDEDLVTVFSLFEMEGLSSPEIAELLEIPLGTVASRLRRARTVFRAAAERLERQVRPAIALGGST